MKLSDVRKLAFTGYGENWRENGDVIIWTKPGQLYAVFMSKNNDLRMFSAFAGGLIAENADPELHEIDVDDNNQIVIQNILKAAVRLNGLYLNVTE